MCCIATLYVFIAFILYLRVTKDPTFPANLCPIHLNLKSELK